MLTILNCDINNVCFVVAHKHVRGYPSYVKHYIDNVKAAYGDESLVVLADNNSVYRDDVFDNLKDLDNVVLLDNNIESKFELGGYQVGLQYILDADLTDKYEYYVFTQDTFIFKNRVDFSDYAAEGATAFPINSYCFDKWGEGIYTPILQRLGLFNYMDKINFCWANSFVVHRSKIEQLQGYLKQIVMVEKTQSQAAERFLARILYELNDHGEMLDIDGDIRKLIENHYDCWKVNPLDPVSSHFVKTVQEKTQHTVDR